MRPRVQLRLYPGWASTDQVWEPVRPHLRRRFDLLEPARPHDPGRPLVLLGWSLGGWRALADAGRERGAEAVLLVACNPSFVRRPGWSRALAPAKLESFRRGLEVEPAATLRRFAALQALGDERAGEVRKLLRAEGLRALERDPDGLERGLERLSREDWRAAFARCPVPLGVILGRGDQVVPAGAGAAMARLRPGLGLIQIEGAGHAPFLGRPAVFAACCDHLLGRLWAEKAS